MARRETLPSARRTRAVAPLRCDLADLLRDAGLPVADSAALTEQAEAAAPRAAPARAMGPVVALSVNHDSSVTDIECLI